MKQYFNLSVRSVGLRQLRGINRLLSDVNSLLISDKVIKSACVLKHSLNAKMILLQAKKLVMFKILYRPSIVLVSIDKEEHEGIMRMKLSKTKWRCRSEEIPPYRGSTIREIPPSLQRQYAAIGTVHVIGWRR